MARYDGMDEMIARVRERLGARPVAPEQLLVSSPAQPGRPALEQYYARGLEAVLGLVHDAEQLRQALTPDRVQELTGEQQRDLQLLLGNVLRELWLCEAALQGVSAPD